MRGRSRLVRVVQSLFGGMRAEVLHWTTNKLNNMGMKAAEGGKWAPSRIAKVVHRLCYTGGHAHNVNARVQFPAFSLH